MSSVFNNVTMTYVLKNSKVGAVRSSSQINEIIRTPDSVIIKMVEFMPSNKRFSSHVILFFQTVESSLILSLTPFLGSEHFSVVPNRIEESSSSIILPVDESRVSEMSVLSSIVKNSLVFSL